MDAQTRRERAYRHYVQHQIKQRQKQMARAQKEANRQLKHKLKQTEPGPPQTTTSVEDVSANSNYPSVFEPVTQPEPAPPFKEPTVNPITVSASDAVAAQDSQQPSRP
jgi:hypothetical protein